MIFPLLSRHAARGDRDKVGADLSMGLRLVLFLAIPAAAGLTLLAEPWRGYSSSEVNSPPVIPSAPLR